MMPLPSVIFCVACSPYTSLRKYKLIKKYITVREKQEWWQSNLSGGQWGRLIYIIMHNILSAG